MKLLFLHGLEGSPRGQKPSWLRNAGHEVIAPDLDTSAVRTHLEGWNAGGRPDVPMPPATWSIPLSTAQAALSTPGIDVVVGSSFGGGLAMELVRLGRWRGPLLLLAPAGRKLFGISTVEVSRLAILHGRHDDVVPLADSIALARDAHADATIRIVNDDHRLTASVAAGLMGELLVLLGDHQSGVGRHPPS